MTEGGTVTSVALDRTAVSPARATVAVLGSVASVQIGAALATHLFPVLGIAGTVTVRLLAATALLVAFTRPDVRALTRSRLRLLVAFGTVLALMNLAFYNAIDRIPLGIAVTIEFAGPLAVAVFGRRRGWDLGWAALAAVGVVLLTGGGRALLNGDLDPLGVALALTAAAGWASYILLSQRVGSALPSIQGLALALAVAAVLVTPAGVVTAGRELLSPGALLLGAAVGALSSALPWGLEMVALQSLPAATFGVLMSLEPAVAALAGLLLLHQTLTPVEVAAIAVICLASAGAARAASARPATP
jgi:inner membrane transporter RhtA